MLIREIELCGTDGMTLTKRIKKINRRVNIIFLKVCGEKEHDREAFRIKPIGYLLKPPNKEQLAAELKNLRYNAFKIILI